MNKLSLVERIKQLGFSEYEAKCYLALLERELLTVSEVSRLAGIPRSNAYEAMERLLAKGLSTSRPGKTKRYAASDPQLLKEKSLALFNAAKEVELEKLERRKKEIMDQKMKEILEIEKARKAAVDFELEEMAVREKTVKDSVETVTSELQLLYQGRLSNGGPLDYIEVIREPLQVFHRYKQLVSEAAKEILVFSKPPYSFDTKKQQSEEEDVVAQALQRGVKVRSIYEFPLDGPERDHKIKQISEWSGQGEEIRLVKEVPMKLAVFDERIAIFALEDPVLEKPSVTSLIAIHHALAKSFKFLFESFWEKARVLKPGDSIARKGKKGKK